MSADYYLKIMNYLLNQCKLVVDGNEHELIELELYLHSKQHPDPFVHMNEQQMNFGTWYFHKGGKRLDSNFRGGTFKGLDIIFGSKTDNIYAGILIRSLCDKNNKLIEGSCNCVNHILSLVNKDNDIPGFIKNHCNDLSIFNDSKNELYIKGLTSDMNISGLTSNNSIIFCCPRVGLSLKKGLPNQKQYIMKNYRMIQSHTQLYFDMTMLKQIKKGKVYIILSLFTTYRDILLNENDREMMFDKIQKCVGSRKKTITQYYEWMKYGEHDGIYNPKSTKTKDICIIYGSINRNIDHLCN